jgi:hypothetical protein
MAKFFDLSRGSYRKMT